MENGTNKICAGRAMLGGFGMVYHYLRLRGAAGSSLHSALTPPSYILQSSTCFRLIMIKVDSTLIIISLKRICINHK